MRFIRLTVFGLLVFASAAQAQHEEHEGHAVSKGGVITVTDDKARSELIFDFPHVTIEHGAMHEPEIMGVKLPISAYFHGFTVEMLTMDGDTAPSSLLHHINLIAPERRELFSNIMQRVGAAGAETGPLFLPRIIGYPVHEGDSLIFSTMLHNPTNRDYEHVMLRVRMKYSRPGSLNPVIAIQPFYMDVMPPAGIHAYELPPGKSAKSWEGSPAVAGRVLGLGGHMHKYGTRIVFEDVTAKKVLWSGAPKFDDSGEVVSMPRKYYFAKLGLQLMPSHVYRVTAEYDNPTGEAIPDGAMGTLGGLFVPDDRAVWPRADRSHPEYIADVKVTYDKSNTGMMMMHKH